MKLAVATALTEKNYASALKNNGVYDLFSAFASTEETEKGKSDGGVYLLAASRLGVPAAECRVFEDIYDGLAGAKRANMTAAYVPDEWSRGDRARCEEIADIIVVSYKDLL